MASKMQRTHGILDPPLNICGSRHEMPEYAGWVTAAWGSPWGVSSRVQKVREILHKIKIKSNATQLNADE